MRRLLGLLVAATSACGSVSDTPSDGGDDGGGDAPPGVPGEYRWVRSLSAMSAFGVADGPGGLVVTGSILAPADLGGGTLTPVGGFDMVVAGFSTADAAHLYSVRHGAAGGEFGFLEVLDSAGAPLVHGVSYNEQNGVAQLVDLGTGPLTGGGGPGADGFIGRYGPGAPAWLARIVGPGEDKIVASASGQGSTVYAAGWFEGTTSFNNGSLTSTGGREVFLARFNTFTGAIDLTKTYGGVGRDEGNALAANGSTLVLAGFFDDTIAFGGMAQPITSIGSLDCFVAKLNPDGTGVWAQRFGGTAGEDRDTQVAIDAAGDVYVSGAFRGQVAFGAINLVSAGGSDQFVAKLRGSDGSVAWAVNAIDSPGDDFGGRIAVDSQGHVAVSGTATGAFAGGTSAGGVDAVLASFDASTGALRWRHVYSTSGDDRGQAVVYGRDGDLYALIGVAGPFDFGKPVIGSPGPAAVLLRVVP